MRILLHVLTIPQVQRVAGPRAPSYEAPEVQETPSLQLKMAGGDWLQEGREGPKSQYLKTYVKVEEEKNNCS